MTEVAFAGVVLIELPDGNLPWGAGADEQGLRRWAQYTAGVEYIARSFGAEEPLEPGARMLVFRGVPPSDLPLRTFEAAKALWQRIRTELDISARIVAHIARIDPTSEHGDPVLDDIAACRRIAAESSSERIALTEELALSLPEALKKEMSPLGSSDGDVRTLYVFPRSAPREGGLPLGEAQKLWTRAREYASGPDVRLVRYVGFRLHKRQPPVLDIRDVFIPSEVKQRKRGDIEERQARELERAAMEVPWSAELLAGSERRASPFRDLFGQRRSLILLGDPGSGKTTWLRWLAVVAASGSFRLGVELGVAERLLPILVSVGRLAEVRRSFGSDPISVPAALARYFHDRGVYEDQEELARSLMDELSRGHCLVLLDGLDEVKGDETAEIHHWLEVFASDYPANRFIASSRIRGYVGFNLPGDAALVELRPLTDEQVERYIRTFHRAYIRWETGAEPATDVEPERLLKALSASPRLLGLARNPFMLSALSLIHRAEGKLPRHRVQAYELFARALCETWAEARRIVAGDASDPAIDYEEEALPMLGVLALAMHERYPTGVAPEGFVIEKLAGVLAEREAVSGSDAHRAAREFLELAGKDVQILLERGAAEWGFLHLTFQEFFVAAGLHAMESFEEVAFQHLFEPRWEEVLRLGVGYMALIQKRPTAVQRFVARVLEHKESGSRSWYTEVLGKQVRMAALLAAEAGDALPAVMQDRVARAFAGWLREMPYEVIAETVAELAITDFGARAATASRVLLKDEHEVVRNRAARVLGAFQSLEAEDDLIACLSDASPFVQGSAAEALQNINSTNLAGKIADKLTDPRPDVRASVIRALARSGERLPAESLKAAVEDSDKRVRRAAIHALMNRNAVDELNRILGGDDPDASFFALNALLELKAVSPEEAAPRMAALAKGIARSWDLPLLDPESHSKWAGILALLLEV